MPFTTSFVVVNVVDAMFWCCVSEGVRRLQHHEGANFSKAIKSTITLENGSKIIKWWVGGYLNGGVSWAWWLEANGDKSRGGTLT